MVNSPAGFEAGVPLVDIPKGFGVDLGGAGNDRTRSEREIGVSIFCGRRFGSPRLVRFCRSRGWTRTKSEVRFEGAWSKLEGSTRWGRRCTKIENRIGWLLWRACLLRFWFLLAGGIPSRWWLEFYESRMRCGSLYSISTTLIPG